MSHKHTGTLTGYAPGRTGMFSREQLLELKPNDILRYFNKLAYNDPEPSANALPKHARCETIKCEKKAISFYMPHHGEWNSVTEHGNPTRDKSVLAMIARMRKFECRQQGKA